MRFFQDLFHLFYPNLCVNCDRNLFSSEKILCGHCKNDLPILQNNDNITELFYGRINVEQVVSFLSYHKNNSTQKLIHTLKYKGREDIGEFLGDWFVREFNLLSRFSDIDVILPVPLHNKKLKARGYNQLTLFGQKISKELNIEFCSTKFLKVSATKTQTFKNRFDRFSNNSNFKLSDPSYFKNKHILLIDDVITTGATLISCCEELLKVEGVKISIATLALTKKI